MTIEERDQAWHTLITCDGKGKDAKAEVLRQLLQWHRRDAVESFKNEPPADQLIQFGCGG